MSILLWGKDNWKAKGKIKENQIKWEYTHIIYTYMQHTKI